MLQSRTMPTSFPANPRRHSLVTAPELRNNIYAQLLLIEGPIMLAPSERTTVPGLVLLRTCKQVHDEVASLFYAANSFQCYVLRAIPVQYVSEGKIQCPDLTSFLSPTTFLDPQAVRGNIFFPAQRYHSYLTRLSISVKALIYVSYKTSSGKMLLRRPPRALETMRMNIGNTQQEIQQQVYHLYQHIGRVLGKKRRYLVR